MKRLVIISAMMVATTIVALGQTSNEDALNEQNRNRAMLQVNAQENANEEATPELNRNRAMLQVNAQENANEEATPELNRNRAMLQVNAQENANEEATPQLNRTRNSERATEATDANEMSAGVFNRIRSAQRSETQVALSQAKRQNNMVRTQALRQSQSQTANAVQSQVRSQTIKNGTSKGKGRQ